MSSIANRYNKGARFNFEIPESFEFTTLKELYKKNGKDTAYFIMAYFFNSKGRFGTQTVLSTTEDLVNAPHHLTEMFEQMRKDPEVIDAINNAKLGFTIYEYQNSYGTHYSLELIDM